MRKWYLFLPVVVGLLVVILLFMVSEVTVNEIDTREKIYVITSISVLEDFVRKIGGEKVQVESLVTGMETPHTFALSPAEKKKVLDADLVVRVGLGLEVWIDDLLAELEDGKVITTSKAPGINILDQDQAGRGGNPHIWLNPDNAKLMIEQIKDALVSYDPGNQDYYQHNYRDYLREIDEISRELRDRVVALPDRRVFSYGAAFPYLLNAFNFEMPLPAQVVPGQEISTRQVVRVIETIKAEEIRIVVETKQSSGKVAATIAEETRIELVYLTPLLTSDVTDYIRLLKYNVGKLIMALQEEN